MCNNLQTKSLRPTMHGNGRNCQITILIRWDTAIRPDMLGYACLPVSPDFLIKKGKKQRHSWDTYGIRWGHRKLNNSLGPIQTLFCKVAHMLATKGTLLQVECTVAAAPWTQPPDGNHAQADNPSSLFSTSSYLCSISCC
jgi:hypothetical protein